MADINSDTSTDKSNKILPIPSIHDFIKPITDTLQESTLYQLSYRLGKTYKELARNSTEHFFPTPVTHLPTGKEQGRYLAVYVGLFYLHVGFIELLGCEHESHAGRNELNRQHQHISSEKNFHRGASQRRIAVRRTLEKAWPIEERLKLEHPVEFFEWIGVCIAEVVGDSLRNETGVQANHHSGMWNENENAAEELVAGISFCFPIVQKSLDEAVLLPTGKGFMLNSDLNLRQALLDGYEKCHFRTQYSSRSPSPVVQEEDDHERGDELSRPSIGSKSRDGNQEDDDDDDAERNRTLKRRKYFSLPKLNIAAMTNDTVATFASLAYSIKSSNIPNSRVVMGLMVGAGSNATVPMKVSDLHPSKTEFFARVSSTSDHDNASSSQSPTISAKLSTRVDSANRETETLVSTEWTLLRSSKPLLDMNILTKWDKIVETQSNPPGFQPMEYIVGGRYMGELVRLIVLDYFTTVLNISSELLPWRLLEAGGLTTDFLSLNVASPSALSAVPLNVLVSAGMQATTTTTARPGSEEDDALAKTLNQLLSSPRGWTWNAEKAGILRTVAFAVMSRSAAVIAAATVGLLACTNEIQLKKIRSLDPDDPNLDNLGDDDDDDDDDDDNGSNDHKVDSGSENEVLSKNNGSWNHGPEELVVAYCGGVIQNYPRYKEVLQRHIDRLLVHGGPQQGGKSILLREVSDGGIIGVGVLAGSVMGRIKGIVGSNLNDT